MDRVLELLRRGLDAASGDMRVPSGWPRLHSTGQLAILPSPDALAESPTKRFFSQPAPMPSRILAEILTDTLLSSAVGPRATGQAIHSGLRLIRGALRPSLLDVWLARCCPYPKIPFAPLLSKFCVLRFERVGRSFNFASRASSDRRGQKFRLVKGWTRRDATKRQAKAACPRP